MAGQAGQIESRAEAARRFAIEHLLGVQDTLDGLDEENSNSINGDQYARLLLDRTYLQGMTDMAAHLADGGSISELASMIARERLGHVTSKIETGILPPVWHGELERGGVT